MSVSRHHVWVPSAASLWNIPVIRAVIDHPWPRRIGNTLVPALNTAMVTSIVLNVIPNEYGFLFSGIMCVGSGIVFTTGMSPTICKHLARETEVMMAMLTIVLNGVLFGIALNDVRASVVPGLMAMQAMAFLTDSLAVPDLRTLLILNALVPTFVTLVLVVFNLAPHLHNEILPHWLDGWIFPITDVTRRHDCTSGAIDDGTCIDFAWEGSQAFYSRERPG
jgi:hypothetical protein